MSHEATSTRAPVTVSGVRAPGIHEIIRIECFGDPSHPDFADTIKAAVTMTSRVDLRADIPMALEAVYYLPSGTTSGGKMLSPHAGPPHLSDLLQQTEAALAAALGRTLQIYNYAGSGKYVCQPGMTPGAKIALYIPR